MEQLGSRLLKEGVITREQLDAACERQRRCGGRIGQNLVELGYLSKSELSRFFMLTPPPPQTIEETGLESRQLLDLVLKHLLFMGEFRLADVAERVRLSLGVCERLMEILRRDKLVEVLGGGGYAAVTYTYKLSDSGRSRGKELLEVCRYVGPAPVTLTSYREMAELQTIRSAIVSSESVQQAFSHLIIGDETLKLLGPAISSGRAVFLYGPAGNGKTAIAETIGNILPDSIFIPHAITVGGEIIAIFDPVNHQPVDGDHGGDPRWVKIRRPVIIAGGELVLRMLDLDFNPVSKYYEASLQMKANNGMFIIDDFGRQQIDPQHLLNRWIVPLDRGVDYMTLHTGMKFAIPFDMLVIFSTNLEPRQLVDEAFLRRIQYKIKIDHPTVEQFREIFIRVCSASGVEFKAEVFDYLVSHYYRRLAVNFNACHPRDLVSHILVNARYYRQPPVMTRESMDDAWQLYFVDM